MFETTIFFSFESTKFLIIIKIKTDVINHKEGQKDEAFVIDVQKNLEG